MKMPESPPENATHSNNGHSSISTQPTEIDAKKSIDLQCKNGYKIPQVVSAEMDFKNFTIRQVLDYFLKNKDQDAWEEFWRRVRPTVRGRCARMLNRCGNDVLDDLEQEVFTKLIDKDCRALRGFEWRDETSIFKYLKVVSASVVIDYIRENRGEIFLDPEDLELAMDTHASHLPNEEREVLLAEIEKCLRSFASEKERQIFVLFYRRGFTAKQIATLPTINLPVRKVENILQGLVRKVRNKLRGSGKARLRIKK